MKGVHVFSEFCCLAFKLELIPSPDWCLVCEQLPEQWNIVRLRSTTTQSSFLLQLCFSVPSGKVWHRLLLSIWLVLLGLRRSFCAFLSPSLCSLWPPQQHQILQMILVSWSSQLPCSHECFVHHWKYAHKCISLLVLMILVCWIYGFQRESELSLDAFRRILSWSAAEQWASFMAAITSLIYMLENRHLSLKAAWALLKIC